MLWLQDYLTGDIPSSGNPNVWYDTTLSLTLAISSSTLKLNVEYKALSGGTTGYIRARIGAIYSDVLSTSSTDFVTGTLTFSSAPTGRQTIVIQFKSSNAWSLGPFTSVGVKEVWCE